MRRVLSLISIVALAIAVSCEDKDNGKNNSPYPTQPTINGRSANTCNASAGDEKTVTLTANSTNAVSYQWGELVEIDGADTVVNIVGETAQILTVTKSGQYYVTAFNDKGDSERSVGKDVTIYQCEVPPVPTIRTTETNVCPAKMLTLTAVVAHGDTFPATKFYWEYRKLSEDVYLQTVQKDSTAIFKLMTENNRYELNTYYEVRVKALSPMGESGWSQSDTVMLIDCTKVPIPSVDYEGVWDVREWWLPYGSTENPVEKNTVMTVKALDSATIEISGWHSNGAGTNTIKAIVNDTGRCITIPFQKMSPSLVSQGETWIAPWDSVAFADPCLNAYDNAFVNISVERTFDNGANDVLMITLKNDVNSKYQPPYTNVSSAYRFASYVLLGGDKNNCTPLGYAIGTTWVKRGKE